MTNGVCGIRPISNIPVDRLGIRTAAEVIGFDPLEHFDRRALALLDRNVQFSLIAAREAMRNVTQTRLRPQRGGAILASVIGQETFETAYRGFYGEGQNRFPPFTVPRCMPSAAASQVSMEFGLRGGSFSVGSACASAAHAIGMAFQMIRAGVLDLALTGGGDASLTPGFIKAWEGLRVLSPDVCRPFSRDRAGLVLGEGAAMFVLEDWSRAAERGADIIAELVGFGMGADAADITAPQSEGAAQAIRDALDDAGLPPESIGYVNAHGTGTRLNDRSETAALRIAFADALPPISSVKSMIGHCLCAGGALELFATVQALRTGILPPTIGFRQPDPECDVDCVPNTARVARINYAISNSFAFGGLNAVLVVSRA